MRDEASLARIVVALALATGLAACQTGDRSPDASASSSTVATAAANATPAAASSEAGYRIAADDTLEVAVFQVPSLNRTVQVDGSGRIDLPLIGSLAASGRTVRDLQTEVARKLGATYLNAPQVTVTVKEALAQRFAVDGAVIRPGVYSAKGDITLLQAVALAGGPSDVGNIDQVTIIRMVGGRRDSLSYSLRTIRSGEAADPAVYGRDAVVVGESGTLSTLKFMKEFMAPLAGMARYAIP